MINGTCSKCDVINKISRILPMIYPIVLIIIGIALNGIIFYVYTRKSLFRTSAGFYFSVSAIVETMALLFGSLKFAINNIFDYDIVLISAFMCKFLSTIIYILCQMASWILVIISIDRLILIKYPYKFAGSRFIKVRIVFIFSVFILISIINIPNLIYLDLTTVNNTDFEEIYICSFTSSSNYIILNFIDLFLAAVLPFIIMMFSGIIASIIIFNSKKKISHASIKSRKKYKFVSTIIARNVLFLVFNLPICIIHILASYDFELNPVSYAYFILIEILANVCVYANFALSFFVHLIFNKEFYKILAKNFKKKSFDFNFKSQIQNKITY